LFPFTLHILPFTSYPSHLTLHILPFTSYPLHLTLYISPFTSQQLTRIATDVWTHGDYILIHPKTHGIYFLGRADGVLNPSGVRFGSAEIYNVIEAFFPDDIQDSICVGQRRPSDTDESVLLFLLMKPGKRFSEDLVKQVKQRIGKECSPRHVPKYVFETPEIPVSFSSRRISKVGCDADLL
jgi:acyl-coenzyme A synthetase/AMP-(fatty) acid ligase